jgi:hypothetical protein
MSDGFVKKLGESIMLSIAAKCNELGARAIGHIKSYMETQAGMVRADTIGVSHGVYSAGNLAYPVKQISMGINCVIPGIFEEALKAAALEGLLEAAEERGISVVKEKERSYFDAIDFSVIMGDAPEFPEDPFDMDEFEEDG